MPLKLSCFIALWLSFRHDGCIFRVIKVVSTQIDVKYLLMALKCIFSVVVFGAILFWWTSLTPRFGLVFANGIVEAG
jgi:hypothetical protein